LIGNQKSVLLILENLYGFILDNFAEYCDRKQKLPAKFQPAFTREVSEKFKTLSFAGNEPDSVLFGKVKTSIKNKLKGNQCRITYGLTVYLEKLFLEIEKI